MDKRNRYFGGCDVGSTTGKAVILDEGGSIVASSIVPTEIDPELTSTIAMDKACASVPGLSSFRDLACLVGTGYGRNEVAFADMNVSEISCHAMGTFSCDPRIKTIVDIGGQDVKAIAVDKDGSVLEFAMNDKCAAGTGRFLEVMARALEADLSAFGDLSARSRNPARISSLCTVFAES